jgi:hypothetical protein
MEDRLISMVALSRAESLDQSRVKASLSRLGASNAYHFEFVTSENDKGVNLVVSAEGVSFAIILMNFPIPIDSLRTAVGGEVVWKEAGDAFLSSTAHILLSSLNPNADVRSLALQARLLSILTAAVADAYPALGIFWSPADYVIEPKFYLRQIPDLLRSDAPFSLWFNLRFYKSKSHVLDQKIISQTRGLAIFMGREIECGPYNMQPGEMANLVLGVARYIFTLDAVGISGAISGINLQATANDNKALPAHIAA